MFTPPTTILPRSYSNPHRKPSLPKRGLRLGICLLLLIAFSAPKPAEAEYNRETVIAANVGISAVLGAVGAAYHAKPGTRLKGFWKGLVYGSVGGGLISLGKYTAT